MLASKIACPNCRTGFRAASSLTPGQKVKCPKCGAYFTMPGESNRLTGSQQRPRQAADTQKDMNLSRPGTREDVKLRERSRSRITPRRGKGKGKLGVILVVLTGLVLIAGVLSFMYWPIIKKYIPMAHGDSNNPSAPAGEVAKEVTGEAMPVSGGRPEVHGTIRLDKDGNFVGGTVDFSTNKEP